MQRFYLTIAAVIVIGNAGFAIRALLDQAFANQIDRLALSSLVTSAIAAFCLGRLRIDGRIASDTNGS